MVKPSFELVLHADPQMPVLIAAPHGGREYSEDVLDALRDAGVETRPIVAGNFTLNPVIEHIDHSIFGDLRAANRIHNQGFFVGNHHYDITEQLNEFKRILKQCLDVQRPASND